MKGGKQLLIGLMYGLIVFVLMIALHFTIGDKLQSSLGDYGELVYLIPILGAFLWFLIKKSKS